MFITVINFILGKYANIKFEELVSKDTNLESVFLISIYFFIYDIFIQKFKDIKVNKFYENIITILSMDKLVLKANILFENLHTTGKNNNKFSNKKNIINHKLNFINQIEISEEIIILIQFFYDYILYDKLDKIFLNSEISNEYITFIEFKETIQQEKLEKNNIVSISDHKYKKIQLDNLNTQFYLAQEKIKILRNKLFLPKTKKKRVLKTYYNYNNYYKNKDDIKVNDILKVRSVKIINKTFNQTYSFQKNRKREIFDFNFSENEKEKNKTSINNYKSNIRNKNNDSFKNDVQYVLLKSIINNNHLLNQKSRIKEKNEKTKRKILKKNFNEKSEKFIQTNISDGNNSINNISIFSSNNNQKTINSNHMIHLNQKIKSFENNNAFIPFNIQTPNNKKLKDYFDKGNKNNNEFTLNSYSKENKIRKLSRYNLIKKLSSPVKLMSPGLDNIFTDEKC